MMIKIFKQGTKDGSDHINYLFNESKHQGYKPELVKGLPFLTRSICQSITNKNKFVAGVLSFNEGETLSEEKQLRLIEMFETTFAPFKDRTRVNFLWVRHYDKGRLELHFITPRIDLKTNKAFNIHPSNSSKTNKQDSNILMYKHFTSIVNYMNKWQQVPQSKHNKDEKGEWIKEENGEKKNFYINRPYTEDNFKFSKKLISDLIVKRMNYINTKYCEKKKNIYNKKKGVKNGMQKNTDGSIRTSRKSNNAMLNSRRDTKDTATTPPNIDGFIKSKSRESNTAERSKSQRLISLNENDFKSETSTQSKSDNKKSGDEGKVLKSSPLAIQLNELMSLYSSETNALKRMTLYQRMIDIRFQLEMQENAKRLEEERTKKLKI